MNSCIYIDGIALWVVLACIIAVLAAAVILGCEHIRILKENFRLKIWNENLRAGLSRTEDKLYKATYRTPEVESNGRMRKDR